MKIIEILEADNNTAMNELWWRDKQPATPPMEPKEVFQAVREVGMKCRFDGKKYMVNFPTGGSYTAFYTADPQKAIQHAKRLAAFSKMHQTPIVK